ncbi:MAG TPA: DUF917 domain-containing protein [Jatrophihabitans sp.]
MLEITVDDVDDLATGAAVLGSGGGGDTYIPTLMAVEAITHHGPVRVAHPAELDPEGLILPLGAMGAPIALVEKFFSGREYQAALSVLEQHLGRAGVGVMPSEVAGSAALLPVTAAAALGLPVVDGDTMRRAFPKLEMTQLGLARIPASPMVLVDVKGNTVLITGSDNEDVERLSRAAAAEMGMIAIAAAYPITAGQIDEFAIPGSLTYCLELGRRIRGIDPGQPDSYVELLEDFDGRVIFTGKVGEVHRRNGRRGPLGTFTLEHLHAPDRVMRVDFQSENLVAIEDGVPIVTVPDLISLVDLETGNPLSTDLLDYGHRVHVLALPAHERWHTSDGIALVGPRAFGYDLDYVPFGTTS